MGVTLHYRGRLKSPELIADISNEVMDICETNNWKYELFEESRFYKVSEGSNPIENIKEEEIESDFNPHQKLPDIGLRGIMFYPHPDCEPVAILFNEKGILNSIFTALFPEVQDKRSLPWSFTKTQFAGPETHIKIVKLLDYLGKKYFKKFNLEDDGGYFPDFDEATLMKQMGVINHAIGTIEDIFENANFEGSPEEVIDQIQNALTRSLKDVEIQVVRVGKDKNDEEENDENKDKPKRKKKDE